MPIDEWRLELLTEDDLPESIPVVNWDVDIRKDIVSLVSRMSPIDRDVILFCCYRGIPQIRVGEILGLSQADISYRRRRAIKIIQNLKVGSFCEYKKLLESGKLILSKRDQDIFESYLLLRKQAVVAQRYSVSQSTVSKTVLRIESMLKKFDVVME